MKLYSYYRSSCAHRVRIALEWKGLEYEYMPVHLTKGGGEQHGAYKATNPMEQVPSLVHEHVHVTESMAIIQYLEREFPEPRLLPKDSAKFAKVIELCEI